MAPSETTAVPPVLQRLARRAEGDEQAIDRFLARNEFPLRLGRLSTFVYRGDVDGVRLRHFIYGLPTSRPFSRLEGTDLWHLTLDLPAHSRVEYKIEVEDDGETRWIRDPLNPKRAHDPFGANSVCHGLGYEIPDWVQPDPEARQGSLDEIELASRAFGGKRKLSVYLPPRFRKSRRYPLLIVHDGRDYQRFASILPVLNNLIYRLEIAPMIVALVDSGDRLREYGGDPRHARFVARDLLPALQRRYPLEDDPSARGLMGASFGAVAALSTAWRHPGVFGRLLLQSGSFAFTDIGENRRGPAFEQVVAFMNRFRARPGKPSERLYVSCGTYESLIYENRSLVPVLQASGMELRYAEARDGHNWENWRDRLREGLSFLYPGPLWMVYE